MFRVESGSLGVSEMLWERQASISIAFSSSPKLQQVFMQLNDIRNKQNIHVFSFI